MLSDKLAQVEKIGTMNFLSQRKSSMTQISTGVYFYWHTQQINPSEEEQITMPAVTNESFEKVENWTVVRQDDIQSLVATPSNSDLEREEILLRT